MSDIFIKCNSHRARDKVLNIIGKGRQSYYQLVGHKHKGIYLVTEEEWQRIKSIPRLRGVTRCRDQNPENYGVCWR